MGGRHSSFAETALILAIFHGHMIGANSIAVASVGFAAHSYGPSTGRFWLTGAIAFHVPTRPLRQPLFYAAISCLMVRIC
jgi:hypothetical protein